MQNKTWGAIITWTYTQPPYLANGTFVYDQMLDAYLAGAKYIVIFDYPQLPGNPYGVLTEDHFNALQKMWNTAHAVKPNDNLPDDAVLVLPQNYGWGMRNANDNIFLGGNSMNLLSLSPSGDGYATTFDVGLQM